MHPRESKTVERFTIRSLTKCAAPVIASVTEVSGNAETRLPEFCPHLIRKFLGVRKAKNFERLPAGSKKSHGTIPYHTYGMVRWWWYGTVLLHTIRWSIWYGATVPPS